MNRTGFLLISVALGLAAISCGDDADSTSECGLDGGCPAASIDASVTTPTTPDSGSLLDAGVTGCGSWKLSRFNENPPLDATEYGHEDNATGSYSQYVCRFKDTVDGRPIVLQGKGVYGYSCYAVLPPGQNPPPRVQPSNDFEVLVGTKDCARMLPYDPSLRLLPTGVDNDGNATYSCHAFVNSLDVPGKSSPLGRFDPVRNKCIFEWYQNVREAPSYEGERIEVLAVP